MSVSPLQQGTEKMLDQELQTIQAGLRSGIFPNEASVSQGIVLRILNALGWPTYDTQVVSPEYGLEGRRVDFSLAHPRNKPRVFIEVKQVGQSDGAERQLFEYAFHKGVPMVILTDGREWNFFLPGELGDYGERRVYKLDILERSTEESVLRLERYLSYARVCAGDALAAARDDYQDVSRDRQIRETLPEAWRSLVDEEDASLLELLADQVGTMCGYKPTPDTVAAFLKQFVIYRERMSPGTTAAPSHATTPTRNPLPKRHEPFASPFAFRMLGVEVPCRNAREVMTSAIEALAERDPTFLDRFVSLPRHGRTRRYIARQPGDLYPGRQDLAEEHSFKLRSGYWIGTNISRHQVEAILEMACEVAGLRYGTDLTVTLGA
jgi:predicted type IV restriction endonuclease